MVTVILVIHLLVALALVGVILLQRSEGSALGGLGGGMSGGGGNFGGLFTARGGANFLTRTTAVLATCFLSTSLLLAVLAGMDREASILDSLPIGPVEQSAPVETSTETLPSLVPQAPIAE